MRGTRAPCGWPVTCMTLISIAVSAELHVVKAVRPRVSVTSAAHLSAELVEPAP